MKVTFTSAVAPSSLNYIMFTGDNASSTTNNSFYNRSLIVGSEECILVSQVGNDYTFQIFVDMSNVQPTSDYYISLSVAFIDGSLTEYTDSKRVYLAPAKVDITAAFLTRPDGPYYLDGVIGAKFVDVEQDDENVVYTAAIQWLNRDDELQFYIQRDIPYNTTYEGIEVILPDGIDEGVTDAYIAVQSVRQIVDGGSTYESSGQLSNTKAADDSAKPLPPRNLTGVYNYALSTPTVVLSWLPPLSSDIIPFATYEIFRKVDTAAYIKIGSVLKGIQTFTDDTIDEVDFNTPVSYYVVAVNAENVSSIPSNIYSIVTIEPSSAPNNLEAFGIIDINGLVDTTTSFTNPTTIGGDVVCGYDNAYFVVKIFEGETLLDSATIDYNSNASTVYEVFITNIPYITTGTTLTSTVHLVTYDENCNEVEGISASIDFKVNAKAIITDVNGVADNQIWYSYDGLDSFNVYSTGQLIGNEILLIAYTTETSNEIENAPRPVPVPTLINDPLSKYDGTYKYEFTSIGGISRRALNITVANGAGLTALAITGAAD